MWFGFCCVMVKDRCHGVLGLSEIEHCVSGQQNPKQNGKRGCAHIFAHLCILAASTSDGHNFLVQTSIRVFVDFTKSSFSLEFNKIKCLAKMCNEN